MRSGRRRTRRPAGRRAGAARPAAARCHGASRRSRASARRVAGRRRTVVPAATGARDRPVRSCGQSGTVQVVISPRRTEAFSDGIFAVAATLLVLDLKVPSSGGDLLPALEAQWPGYAAYAVSFLTIGIIWVNHHAVFDRLRHIDRPL